MAFLARLMLHALAWLFACVLLLAPLQALAYPATPGGYITGGVTGSTAQNACYNKALQVVAAHPPQGGTPASLSSYGPYSPNCFVYCRYGGGGGFQCYMGAMTTYGASCPNGGTLSGGECVCPEGDEDTGAACVEIIDPDEEYCTQQNGTQAVAVSSPKPSGTVGLASYPICYSNQYSLSACSGTMEPDMCGEGPDGKWHCTGKVTFSDSVPCTGTLTPENPEGVPEPLPEPPPPGMCPGEVNGVTVNVPCKSTTSATTSSKSTSEGGTTTEETKTRETTCTGAGSCTTTTTTNTTVGGVTTTKTETTTEPLGEFCAANPGAAECGQQSTFGGSCQSNFTCTGDPVQCATARAVNDHLCKFKDLMEMPSDVQSLAQSVLDGTHVENPRDSAMQIDVGIFDQSDPLSSACPGDIPVSLSGFSFVIPLSEACDWLQIIGNILVICSLFGATVFVLRGAN